MLFFAFDLFYLFGAVSSVINHNQAVKIQYGLLKAWEALTF
jgi:hypothetical protein